MLQVFFLKKKHIIFTQVNKGYSSTNNVWYFFKKNQRTMSFYKFTENESVIYFYY